ncbi:MAG: hypothetical protein ACOCW6_07660, partial [Spirochaetota bacterium]
SMRSGLFILCAIVVSGVSLGAQSVPASPDSLRASGVLDWTIGTLQMSVEAPLDPKSRNAPAEPHYREQAIHRRLPALIEGVLSNIFFDSSRTIGDVLEARPELIGNLYEVGENVEASYSRVAKDLSTVEVIYYLDLYPEVIQTVHSPADPRPLPRALGWHATDDFSGVVILASDLLPVRGEETTSLVRPALLPEILDTTLNPVLTAEHIEPEVFTDRGVVSYTTSLDPADWEEVVGSSPLRILARETFGINRTDIIINRRDAGRLLSTETNRRVLSEGRVLVVIDSSVIRRSFRTDAP